MIVVVVYISCVRCIFVLPREGIVKAFLIGEVDDDYRHLCPCPNELLRWVSCTHDLLTMWWCGALEHWSRYTYTANSKPSNFLMGIPNPLSNLFRTFRKKEDWGFLDPGSQNRATNQNGKKRLARYRLWKKNENCIITTSYSHGCKMIRLITHYSLSTVTIRAAAAAAAHDDAIIPSLTERWSTDSFPIFLAGCSQSFNLRCSFLMS